MVWFYKNIIKCLFQNLFCSNLYGHEWYLFQNAVWLEEIDSKLDEIFLAPTLQTLGPLACILHGDYWNNNMLFRHDDVEVKKPLAVKMVDFQIARLHHPLTDVLYFLYSSTTPEMREKHMQQLLTNYFTTLTSSLQKLGVDLDQEGYNIDRFFVELKKRSIYGMTVALMVIPTVLDKKMVDMVEDMGAEVKESKAKGNNSDFIHFQLIIMLSVK